MIHNLIIELSTHIHIHTPTQITHTRAKAILINVKKFVFGKRKRYAWRHLAANSLPSAQRSAQSVSRAKNECEEQERKGEELTGIRNLFM